MSVRVSVVMPAFNAERWVGLAVRSVRRQTLTDWELIVVDDGSTDATADIVQRHAARDARVRLMRRPHQGIVATLNAGLSAARGNYLARMDADDLCHRDRLRQQTAFLDAHPETMLVSCLVSCFPRRQIREGMARYQAWLNSLVMHEQIVRDIFVESPFAHPSVMMRREGWEQVGGYLESGWAEDYDLWLRCWRAGFKFAKVEAELFYWRDTGQRLTRSDPRYALARFRELKLHHLTQTLLAGEREVQVWGAGKAGRVWARTLEAAGLQVVRFIDIDPRKIGGRLRGAPVEPPEALLDRRPEKILVVVGVKGARQLIRDRLDGMQYVEHRDYVCVA